jgi:hypothetical protein
MNTHQDIPPDWICVDCLMWLANGETDPDWTDQQRAAFLASVARGSAGYEVTLGMLAKYHECASESGAIADDCECEQDTFSWSPCALCGSPLGGSRHAATFWIGR